MRLLIMACSVTKRPDAGTLPAIDRYDGPSFRTYRAWARQYTPYRPAINIVTPARWPGDVEIDILSAKHGLIGAYETIADYDLQMPSAIDTWPHHATLAVGLGELVGASVSATFLMFGTNYRAVWDRAWTTIGDDQRARFGHVTAAVGGIGTQLGQLKRWLTTPEAR